MLTWREQGGCSGWDLAVSCLLSLAKVWLASPLWGPRSTAWLGDSPEPLPTASRALGFPNAPCRAPQTQSFVTLLLAEILHALSQRLRSTESLCRGFLRN